MYGSSINPNTIPPINATPDLSKKKRFPIIPANHVQSKKKSGIAVLVPTFLLSNLQNLFNIPIKPIPVSNQPNALDSGISG
jgi:hypothetical protein